MNDDGLSLGFFLILVPAFFLGKVLVKAGVVVTHDQALVASRWTAGAVGLGYAIVFQPVRDFGFPLGSKILMGVFAGVAVWFLIWMGFVWALTKAEGTSSKTSPTRNDTKQSVDRLQREYDELERQIKAIPRSDRTSEQHAKWMRLIDESYEVGAALIAAKAALKSEEHQRAELKSSHKLK